MDHVGIGIMWQTQGRKATIWGWSAYTIHLWPFWGWILMYYTIFAGCFITVFGLLIIIYCLLLWPFWFTTLGQKKCQVSPPCWAPPPLSTGLVPSSSSTAWVFPRWGPSSGWTTRTWPKRRKLRCCWCAPGRCFREGNMGGVPWCIWLVRISVVRIFWVLRI